MENNTFNFIDFIRNEDQCIQLKNGEVYCKLSDKDGENYEMFVGIEQLKEIGALTQDEINQISQIDPLEIIINNDHDKSEVGPVDANQNRSIEDSSIENGKEIKEASNGVWNTGITKFMLEKYSKIMSCVGPMKKFKNKISMWKQIASDIEEELNVHFTYIQVENRYKTICKRKKSIIDNNKSTGASRMNDVYEEEWKEITNNDDSILPEVLRSCKTVVINKKDCLEPKQTKIKKKDNETMLLNFLKEKEIVFWLRQILRPVQLSAATCVGNRHLGVSNY